MDKIKIEELKEKFPKAIKRFGEYIAPVGEMFKENSPEMQEEIAAELVEIVIVNNPKILYDFFDRYKLFISVMNKGDEQSWHSSVSSTEFSEDAESRAEAEQKSYINAFKALEEEL